MKYVHEHMEGDEKKISWHFEIRSPPGIEPGAFLNLILAPKQNGDVSVTNPRLSALHGIS
jgi:hypothetical protein